MLKVHHMIMPVLQVEERATVKLAEQRAMHDQELASEHASAEGQLRDTIAHWQQKTEDSVAAVLAAKTEEMVQLSRSHAAAMADRQSQHCQEVNHSARMILKKLKPPRMHCCIEVMPSLSKCSSIDMSEAEHGEQ